MHHPEGAAGNVALTRSPPLPVLGRTFRGCRDFPLVFQKKSRSYRDGPFIVGRALHGSRSGGRRFLYRNSKVGATPLAARSARHQKPKPG
jgi:hypothetical protein